LRKGNLVPRQDDVLVRLKEREHRERGQLADAASMAAPLYSILSPQSRRLGGKDLGSPVE